MSKFRKLLSLSIQELLLLIITYSLLITVRLGLGLLTLKLVSFKSLQLLLRRLIQYLAWPRLQHIFTPQHIVRFVQVSARYMPGKAKCLAKALTTYLLMGCLGYSPQLRIGVLKDATGNFSAHAWIEHQGEVVIGQLNDLSSYTDLTQGSSYA